MQAPVYSASSLDSNSTSWPSHEITCDKGETRMTLTKISRILFSIYQVQMFLGYESGMYNAGPMADIVDSSFVTSHAQWKSVMKNILALKK